MLVVWSNMPSLLTRVRTALTVALLVATGAPVALSAQGVTGVVRHQTTAAPLPGVLVSVLNLEGERVRGALTDSNGRYVIAVPMGRYQLRAERIGLGPVTVGPFDVRNLSLFGQSVTMVERAVAIEGLLVDTRVQSCRIDQEAAVRIQRWWGEIRTALDVSSVLQREQFATFHVEKFEREWDADLDRVIASNSRIATSTSSKPFVSAEADFLAEGGFVQGELAGGRDYFAPDADVLLSDVFLSQHCFSLTRDRDREDQLGLRFEPVREKTVTDILGTLWVDTTTAELQSLEYRYSNLEGLPANESGGRVAFSYLPSGAWIVSEWYIRMPKLGVRQARRRRDLLVIGYLDVGGHVTPVAADGEAVDPGAVGAIRGVVFDSIRGGGVVGATVTVLGTRHQAITDVRGEFVLTDLPVGTHDVTFFHEDTDAWGLGSAPARVTVRESLTAEIELAIPSFRQAAMALCLADGTDATTVVVGHVLGPDRSGLGDVPIEFTWRPQYNVDRARSLVHTARTGSDGRFVVCELPGEARVAMRADIGGRWIDAFDEVVPLNLVTYREVWIKR